VAHRHGRARRGAARARAPLARPRGRVAGARGGARGAAAPARRGAASQARRRRVVVTHHQPLSGGPLPSIIHPRSPGRYGPKPRRTYALIHPYIPNHESMTL
jgi:hypothetical protein